jgi:hypothetical protein
MSLVRSLASFYRERLRKFVEAGKYKREDTAVKEMVVVILLTANNSSLVTKEDLTMAILALLNATTCQARKTRPRKKAKGPTKKFLHNFVQLPFSFAHRATEFSEKTKVMSVTMYRLTKASLNSFISTPANITLITFFAENDGLAATDQKFARPTCRKTSLDRMI